MRSVLQKLWPASLKGRGLALIGLSVSMTVLLVSGIGLWQGRKALEDQGREELETIANLVAESLDAKIRTRFDALTLLAGRLGAHRLEEDGSLAGLQALFDEVLLIDATGTVQARYPKEPGHGPGDYSNTDFFRLAREQMTTIMSEPAPRSGDGAPMLYMAAPVFNAGQNLVGVLAGGLDLRGSLLDRQVRELRFGETGYIGIGTLDGMTVSHPRSDQILQPVPRDREPLQAALDGREGVFDSINIRGEPSFFAVRQMDAAPWFVVVIMPKAEVLAPARRGLISALIAALGAIALLLPLSWAALRRLLNPLGQLAADIQGLEDGAVTRISSPGGGREVESLAASFNTVFQERGAALERMAEREAFFRSLWESAPLGLMQMNVQGTVEHLNPAFSRIIGIPAGQARGRHWLEGLHQADRERVEQLWAEALRDGRSLKERFRLTTREGRPVWVEAVAQPIATGEATLGFIAALRDITGEKVAREMLDSERQRALRILDTMSEGVVLTDFDGRIRYLNGPARTFLGAREAGTGYSLFDFGRFVEPSGPVSAAEMLARPEFEDRDLILESRDGTQWELEMTMLLSGEHPHEDRVFVLRDDSDRRRYEEQLSWQATHDALTGLLNRRGFTVSMTHWLGQVAAQGDDCVLAMVDLDHFKPVNDEGGHLAGDLMLRALADAMRARVRQSDIVARMGGDEFALLLPGCSLERGKSIAEAVRQAIATTRIVHDGREYGVTASIGVIRLCPSDESPRRALARADELAYEAKGMGRDRVVSEQQEMGRAPDA